MDKKLGNLIRELRLKQKKTQKEVANMLNKSESTIRMWELSKSRPYPDVLKTLAIILSSTKQDEVTNYVKLMHAAGYDLPEQDLDNMIIDSIVYETKIKLNTMIQEEKGLLIGLNIAELYFENKNVEGVNATLIGLLSDLKEYNRSTSQNKRVELSSEIRKQLEYLLIGL